MDEPANAHDLGLAVRVHQELQPVGRGDRIVVEERDDLAA
jgi:hypothetical protein